MKICLFIIVSSVMFSTFLSAETIKVKAKLGRNPSQEASDQACITFHGDGAKKTFLNLYPYTQGKVTAIVAEETKMGDTIISTENIFCRVYKIGLPQDVKKAMKSLKALSFDKFQCGYFISSEGDLSACSDPE